MAVFARPVRAWFWTLVSSKPKLLVRATVGSKESKARVSNDSISFFSSLCVHTLLILVLALITTGFHRGTPTILLSFDDTTYSLDIDSPIEMGVVSDLVEIQDTAQQDQISPTLDLLRDTTTATLEQRIENDGAIPNLSSQIGLVRSSLTSSVEITGPSPGKSDSVLSRDNAKLFEGASLKGRGAVMRRGLALKNGGTVESEKAVEAALVWFAAHQAYDGSWSTDMNDTPCNGRCTHGTEEIGSPKRIAATGLALLCFLGAGYTHKEGKYQDEVKRGIHFLTKSMKKGNGQARSDGKAGSFAPENSRYEMYEHGIAMLALCEACEMGEDTSLLDPCRLGIRYLIRCQHADGSWGYTPSVSGDLSIIGWQMMALKSANRIGIKTEPTVLAKVDRFMETQQSDYGAYYGYRSTQRDPCATSIGLLLRLYRGRSNTNPSLLKGLDYIAGLGPSTDGIYYNYYATQLLFHTKHSSWPQWNRMNRDYLVREQGLRGHEQGSWYLGRSHFNQVGGRLYCTAMATLSLEVYYRFMPIYETIEPDDFQL